MRGSHYTSSLPSLSRTIAAGLVIAVVIALSVVPLSAQVDTGSISGTVADPSGAVVGGAKVTLTNEGTGASLSTATGSDGLYNFSPLKIGSYTLSVSAPGFQTTTQRKITVNVSSSVLTNVALKPGQVTETVEVTTSAPVLETQNASVGQVVNSKSVNDLPLNGRNFTFLAQLAAGVNTPQADTRGNASTGAFAANGLRPAQNNYMLDGIDNNSDTVDFLNGTNFVVLPPVDAIQEFKVQTSDFSAEFGRSGAAVLNATIKSGTNNFHGSAWEFFRNDVLDGRDWFEPASSPKGEYRQNQYGVSIGGPVIRNKVFFFGDYEGLRRRQGVPHQGTVPTALERSSGYTDFSELISGQITGNPAKDIQTDLIGRHMPTGTILDPSTTRSVGCGQVDFSGIATPACAPSVATGTLIGYVRDPFGLCAASTPNFTLAGCGLNQLPNTTLRPLNSNAISLLNLFPAPTNGDLSSNFSSSPKLSENRNAFDTRVDFNLNDKNQIFARFSFVDDPQLIPGIFGGVPDGGGFQEGNQTALAQQSALAYTHVFSSSMVNEIRAGLSYLHTTRVSPAANDLSDLPGQFGVQAIPQEHENGGLPAFGIQGLQTLGSNAFLPSDEVSSTFQVTDNFTKIYGKHTFKMGFEFQHVKFSTLQPPWSRGQFNFDGAYTNIPGASPSSENTGIAQFLLNPIAAQSGGNVDYVGGPSAQNGGTAVFVSNISLTDNGKNYYGSYFNDDWKVTPKLTVNLGLRWDFFGLVLEHHANQANFVPSGAPFGGPAYIIPKGGANTGSLSPSFETLLAQDGIKLAVTDEFGKGLGNSQKANFAPRVGFAYQITPKFVARGGFGLFYNGFENRGFSPNLGENYPFQFNFSFNTPKDPLNRPIKDDSHPIIYNGCTSAGPIGNATLETGFACTPLDPALVNASGLALRGIQFNYVTPYSMGGNFTLQYQVTPTMSVQAGYVTSLARHLEVFPGSNNPTAINGPKPFADFGQNASFATTDGNSYYHGLQTKVEKQFSHGLNLLATYTWSKVRTDAVDLLNGGSGQGYRASNFPDFGIHGDYGLAPFDIRNVFHLSGGYELPFGKGKRFLSSSGGIADKLAGGWSIQFIATLQGGQPMTLNCANGTASGTGCYDFLVAGQDTKLGLHRDAQNKLNWFGNPGAFTQPCQLDSGGSPDPNSVAGCIPLTGNGLLGGGPSQVPGPGFHRLDFSTFKDFQLSERFRLQFRAEFFNILNHPNFNAPGFGGNGVVAISGATNFTSPNFGEIGSTRDAPNDPRQIQFALKLYY